MLLCSLSLSFTEYVPLFSLCKATFYVSKSASSLRLDAELALPAPEVLCGADLRFRPDCFGFVWAQLC